MLLYQSMRTRTVISGILGLVVLSAVGISLWILRQPLHETYQAIANQATSSGPKVRFAVVGDNHGDNPIYRQILTELKDEPIDFVVNLADTSENGTRTEFEGVKVLESQLSIPVYHTVGNHDIKTDPTRALDTEIFGVAPWYSFTKGSVHFVILDNADRKVGFPAASLDWLATDLAAHESETILIAYHRPFDLPLGQVVGDDETSASRATAERFKKIIAAYPVKFIFTAHLHTYIPYTVNDIPAVVSGGGGDPAQTVLGGPANNLFHYLLVTVQNGRVAVEVKRVQLRESN